MDGVFAYMVAAMILTPICLVTALVCELPPIKRWLNRMALRMPMFYS